MSGGEMIDIPVGQRSNSARMGQNMKRGIRNVSEGIYTTEIVMVQDYDFAAQTVDVVLKSNPDVPVIKGVPIASGGELRMIRTFKTIANGDPDPTVGIIAYPRTDGRLALLDFQRIAPINPRKHTNYAPVYIGDVPVIAQLPFENHFENADKDSIGPKDTGFQHALTGSFLLFKENGDVVLKSKGKVYIGGLEQKASAFKTADVVGAFAESKKVKLG